MSYWQLLSPSGPRDSSTQKTKALKQKKLVFRPPSLKLRRNPFKLETKVAALRGTVSDQSSPTVNKDMQTMPAHADTTHGPSGSAPGAPAKHMAAATEKTQGQSHHLGLKEEDFAGGDAGDTRSASPRKSLDTMMDLESPQDSEADSEISPLSDYSHPLRSASRLARFFPELSSHFAVVSPVSADSKMDRSTGPSFFERELEERVQTLYRSSSDVAPDAHGAVDKPQITLSSFGSDETLDCASSCYSHRTSVTSVGSTFWGDDGRHPYKTADAYSIYSPVAAGVFDDAGSICPSRPSSSVAPCHLHVSKLARPIPITKKASMNDFKNKPLPLEPSFGPSSAPSYHDDSPLSAVSPHLRPKWSTQYLKRDSLISLQHPTTLSHSDWKHSMLHQLNTHRDSKHPCQTCEHSQHQPQRQGRQRSGLAVAGHRTRHVPTLSQAAEELENTLAGLGDQDLSHKTLLILDGPLQISRHNGDLIATRPAPLPLPPSLTHKPRKGSPP